MHSFVGPSADGFGLENLPYGIFSTQHQPTPRPAVAIADHVLDLSEVRHLFNGPAMAATADRVFQSQQLNDFMSLGPESWQETRTRLQDLLSADGDPILRTDPVLRAKALIARRDVQMHLPAAIGDYTDFYSSLDHAKNVGSMFRTPDDPLLPNWRHLPVGYHGRASSVVVSGTAIHRPRGQIKVRESEPPIFAPSRRLDFELEVGFLTGSPATRLGHPVAIDEAEKYIFGLVLVNDWSARDIQKWEYVPLGPFTSKNLATSMSPWVVPLQALDAFRVAKAEQDPSPLPYLTATQDFRLDIQLMVDIDPRGDSAVRTRVATSNFKYMYWTMKQQLAHHTITGCNIRPGDLMASGTVSGPGVHESGSLLELSRNGSTAVRMRDGSERSFLEDGDNVILTAVAGKADGVKISFGQCSGHILPPIGPSD